MKKFIVFVVSFILLFLFFQVMVGMFLTFTYTPDLAEAWNMSANLSQEVVIKSSQRPFLLTLAVAVFSLSIAYFISKKTSKNK